MSRAERNTRILALHAEGLSFTQIGAAVGVSRCAAGGVVWRAKRPGDIRASAWGEEEDALLREAWSSSARLAEVQNLFPNFTRDAICARAARIGCPRRRRARSEAPARPRSPPPVIDPALIEDRKRVEAEAEAYRAQRARFARLYSDRGADSGSYAQRVVYRPGIDPRPAKYALGVSR